MSDLPLIDLSPADATVMHPHDLYMWIVIGAVCCLTLGFVAGVSLHVWVR